MATLLNSGTVVFTPAGGAQTSLVSNTTATDLAITYALSVSHAAAPTAFVTGDTVLYTVVVRSTGTGNYEDPTVTVDMAGGALSYVPGSAGAFLDTGDTVTPLDVTASPTETGQKFSFGTATLPAGGVIYLNYNAVVTDDAAQTLTSTATASAVQGSAVGTVDSATDAVTITRTPLTIVKSAPAAVSIGETLAYVFTLTNTGSAAVTVNALTDELPANFSFASATLSVAETPVPLTEGTDYTVTEAGLFTLGPVAGITLPAGAAAVVTVTGTVVA